jgi:hypothetical protein
MGFGAGSSGKDDEVGPATCEADAWIDATSWRCRSLFAVAEGRGTKIFLEKSRRGTLSSWEIKDERKKGRTF